MSACMQKEHVWILGLARCLLSETAVLLANVHRMKWGLEPK